MGPGPDKIVENLLKAKIKQMMTDDAPFDGYLYECSTEEIERCRTHFRAHPPTAKLGYARTSDKWPVWAVILSSKRPSQEYIGRSGGTGYIGEVQCQKYVSVVAPTISLWVYSENADVTRWHSDIVEGILNTAQPELMQYFEEYAFGGAMDLNPEQIYVPENLWVRSQTWDFTVSQTFLRALTNTLTGPPYVGVSGEDLGDEVKGGVVPYSDR